MLACVTALTLAAASVGQAAAPAEAAWLDSVPADAEVVLRVRALDEVRDDLLSMIRAMSRTLSDQVEPVVNGIVEQMAQTLHKDAPQTPFLVLARAETPEEGEAPPFAVLVGSDDYAAVLSAANQGLEPRIEEVDGLDTFEGPDGDTVYAAQGDGFVVLGIDRELVGGVARPAEESLADALPAELSERLLGGDLGLYVNMAVVTDRYGEQIDAARDQLVAVMEQAGEQAGNEEMMKGVGELYGRMFDSIKVAEGFALNLDFDAAALAVSAEVTLKADSEPAARLADAVTGNAENLAKLPADAAYFVYMNVEPATFASFQQVGMSMMFSGGDVPVEMQEALALQDAVGRVESVGSSSVLDGMRTLNVMTAANPEKLVEMTVASQKAMGTGAPAGMNFIKDVEVTPEAETYKGYTFTRSIVTFDLDALAAGAQPNAPMTAEMMRGMFGGESITTWTGTDGTTVLSVAAPDWEDAQAQIDTYLAGDQGIGASAGYSQVRALLPDQVNLLMLVSAQGLVRQLAGQFSSMFGAQLAPPGDMPREPALLGLAAVTTKSGYRFDLVVPSPVGPVIEKGLIPLFMGLQGQVQQ